MPTNKFSCCDLSSKNSVINDNHIINKYCTKEEITLLVNQLGCRFYKKGETVFYEGQPNQLIYFVYTGFVKLWKEGVHREEQVIRFAKNKDILGFWGCLENKNYSLSATVMTDTNICYINKNIFFDILKKNNFILFHLLHDYTIKIKKIELNLRNLVEMNVREKVAKSILVLFDCFRDELDNKSMKTILSRSELASIAGINKDSVGKQLTLFKNENIIAKNNDGNITIDEKALENIIKPYLFLDGNEN